MVPAGTDRKAFDAYDVEVNTVTGKMMTVRIPIKQFEQLVTSGLQVTISGAPEGPMSIYDILGRRVLASPTANSTFRLPATGVYIIRIGELCRKMVVR